MEDFKHECPGCGATMLCTREDGYCAVCQETPYCDRCLRRQAEERIKRAMNDDRYDYDDEEEK